MQIWVAAYQVMAHAYAHAAGSIGMANARQVMYAARPDILRLTGRASFDDKYFTQQLLPDYQRSHPEETAGWDVLYDDRGHFAEPHTGRMIGLGTLSVREYLARCRDPEIVKAAIAQAHVETFGPLGRYRNAVFIEKEGLLPILEHENIDKRFDCALMSTKGMSVTAARQLIDGLAAMGMRIFVLHDFDISGFSIRKTFTTSGRRHKFKNDPKAEYIGLGLADVERLARQRGVSVTALSEPVALKGSREAKANRLRINGATEAEIDFLLTNDQGQPSAVGKRVELNVMTSDEFTAFVIRKLIQHGTAKVVPDAATLNGAREVFVREKRAKDRLAAELERINAEPVAPLGSLEARVRGWLEGHPTATWDDAVRAIVEEE
jgi:hypothetical protein